MKITPLGDSALTIRVREEFQSDPENCLRQVGRVRHLVQAAQLPGVHEVTTAFASVTVFYDPAHIWQKSATVGHPFERLVEEITRLAGAASDDRQTEDEIDNGIVWEIPVCYDREFGLDLGIVAAHASLTEAEVIAAHSRAVYRVGCIGFVPGFPFLVGLPRELATPRSDTPRTAVPAGSVAIGGAQTGIYPQQSPGGWNVIGRTPLRLFDANRNPPALLAMGAAVRFCSITRAEFEAFCE